MHPLFYICPRWKGLLKNIQINLEPCIQIGRNAFIFCLVKWIRHSQDDAVRNESSFEVELTIRCWRSGHQNVLFYEVPTKFRKWYERQSRSLGKIFFHSDTRLAKRKTTISHMFYRKGPWILNLIIFVLFYWEYIIKTLFSK